MTDTGIVIVTHNSAAAIGPCLDAALRTGAEVVVVDNASSDRTGEVAARIGVRVILNSTNLGFAGAVNQGFSVLNCTYILLLNPDAVLQSSLEPLRAACELPQAAGAGGLLLDLEEKPQVGFMVRKFPTPAVLALEALLLNRAWARNPINRAYRGLELDYSRSQIVDQPAGAFLMIRRTIWEELGGFDEGFWPVWFEDVDFCRRAVHRQYHWYFVPEAVAKHTGAHSISKLTLEKRLIYWYGSLLRYSAKHFHPMGRGVACAAVVVGSILRMWSESVLQRSLKPVAAYSKVIVLAARYFFGRVNYSKLSVFGLYQ
ncbi:MAG TPA: glycosyltransferase family 2 protein [Bryobacteraceae bacterium]|nr:glycosyltransferase family 2 protein [Bryobacteraceae bacterium]